MYEGNVNEKKQLGDGGALRGADFDWGHGAGCALEDHGAGALAEEGGDPVVKVDGNVFSQEESPELLGIEVVEARLDVEEEG